MPLRSHLGPEAMYEYDLFAVINHEGQINNGHYTNFARFQDEVGSNSGWLHVLYYAPDWLFYDSGTALTMTSTASSFYRSYAMTDLPFPVCSFLGSPIQV